MAEKVRVNWKSFGLVKDTNGRVLFNGQSPSTAFPQASIDYALDYGTFAMMTRKTARSKGKTMTREEMAKAIKEVWDWLADGMPKKGRAGRKEAIAKEIGEKKAHLAELQTAYQYMKAKDGKEVLGRMIWNNAVEIDGLEKTLKALQDAEKEDEEGESEEEEVEEEEVEKEESEG